MTSERDVYSFYKITDIELPLRIRISSLVGKLEKKSRTELLENPEYRFWGSQVSEYPDLYVICRLYADNKPLTPTYQTAYKQFHKDWIWNEWIQFPYMLNELPLNAQIGFTIYDTAGPNKLNVVGGTTFRLFGKRGTLRKAQHRLFVWRGKEADGSAESATPSKIGGMKDEMGRLEKLIKKHKRGDFPAVDWLDSLAYRQISLLNKAELESSSNMFLYIDMPQFELPVVFCEPEPKPITLPPLHTRRDAPMPAAAPAAGQRNGQGTSAIDASMFTILDPEIARDNPIEAKFRRMARNHRGDPLDQEMKPSADVRDQLNEILAYPPTRALSGDEMDLVWRFRFYLTRDPKGLTKFLKSVSWSDAAEATQATEVIMTQWTTPAIDDALELLGPTFKDARVRAYAVGVLEKADDTELNLYLLQLVQAIKFDNLALLSSSIREERDPRPAGTMGANEASREASAAAAAATSPAPSSLADSDATISLARPSRITRSQSSVSIFAEHRLADLLIKRGIRDRELGNNLFWYLSVECEDKAQGSLFASVRQKFLDRLLTEAPDGEGRARRESLERQTRMMKLLAKWATELRFSKEARPKKIDKLRSLLVDPKAGMTELLRTPLTLPLDARISIEGVVPEKSSVFKSNQLPLYLHLVPAVEDDDASAPPLSYPVIFKNGDDLRQDQLVMQLFTLMDRLLRNENLDLRITPYKVLATGAEDGMVQFIESQSINAILSQYQGSLLNYLRKHSPSTEPGSEATYGIRPEVLDTYVRSCAGYSVLTYLLEVGDRHLDNLLLSPDGHFFHVDFGYILGRDPKPYPPPIRVTREMIDAMGGVGSPHYARWKNHCFNAFIVLRKSANLILNLLALMIDSNVRDVQREPDKAVARVQERFCLHLKDAEAIQHLDKLLTSGGFLGTVVTIMDTAHNVAQYIRS